MPQTMQAPPQGGGGGKQSAALMRPFVAGTRTSDRSTYDVTKTLTTSQQDLPLYNVDPNGYIQGLFILATVTASGNSANVAFNADAPPSGYASVTFNDTNNKPILGPMTGHDLYECVKFGGYSFVDDTKESPIFSATTGTGGSGGSAEFCLYLPIEIVHRDGLGSLTNKSSSATFSVALRLGALSDIYSTAPTAAPTWRTQIEEIGWMDPNAVDMRGNAVQQNPPANNTTQYWSKQTYSLNSGAFSQRLIGIDSLVRNLIFILVDSTPSRTQGDSDFPDPFTFQYETVNMLQRLKQVWWHKISREWGYNNAVETAGGRDYGVYPLTFCQDFTAKPGYETRLGYLPVSSATALIPSGTIGGSGAHTLTVLVNKIVPANGDPVSLSGR